MAEIRLTWWSEVIGEIFEGRTVRRHPVALALADAVSRRGLPRDMVDALVDQRFSLIETPAHASEASEAALMSLAIQVLGGEAPEASRAAAALRFGAGDKRSANHAAKKLSVQAFPAIAYSGLALSAEPAASILRRLRILAAVLSGRL